MLKKALYLVCILCINVKSIAQTQNCAPEFYFTLTPGFNIDRISTSGNSLAYLKFNHPTQPYISAIIDFDDLKGFILRTELVIKPLHFKAWGYPNKESFDEYELKSRAIIPSVSILYRVPWRWAIRPYIGMGSGGRISKQYLNKLTTQTGNAKKESAFYLDLDGLSPTCTIGAMYNKRFDFNLKLWWAKLSDAFETNRRIINISYILSFGVRLYN